MNKYSPSSSSGKTRGVALVIVLAMLVLITALVVAFFTSVTSDFSSSKAYSNGENAKQLADSAVNIVMAQIKDATAGFAKDASGNPIITQRLAWASQPGMVRTWDDSGNPYKVFKLYSSGTMVLTGAYNTSSDSEVSDITGVNWKTQPSIYTDLNSPVLISDTNGNIIPDPTRPADKYTAVAPIIDPNLALSSGTLIYKTSTNSTIPDIEGFSATLPPASVFNGNLSNITPSNNPVPMPVKWLYVLKNGSITVPTFSNGNAVFNTPQPVPSTSNPIVGRIAFWTDDETCKVNINTASEGVFWDVPVCASLDEMPLAANPPAKGEFQRVPGHPAMTCLSSLFANRIPVDHTINPTLSTSACTAFQSSLQNIYNLTPRIMPGTGFQGSQGGTAPIADRNFSYPPAVGRLNPNVLNSGAQDIVIATPIPTGTTRIFASVDEFLMGVSGTPSPVRPTITTGSTGILPGEVRRTSFFATTDSRAPEVTLFNGPRVSLWPITWPYQSAHFVTAGTLFASQFRLPKVNGIPTNPLTDLDNVPLKTGSFTSWITPQEKLLAFCAEIGKSGTNGYRYFFQRQNPDSPTYDWQNIQRNKDLLGSYLYNLTGSSNGAITIPGFGGSFTGKYGAAGRDFILVSLFDSIRGSLNLSTSGTDSNALHGILYNYAGMGLQTSGSGANPFATDQPATQVAPINIDLGSGAKKSCGQFTTIPEVALVFMATKRNDPWPVQPGSNGWLPTSGTAGYAISGTVTATGSFNANYLITGSTSQTTQMQMFLVLNQFTPSSLGVNPSYWVKATGASFQVDGQSIGFPAQGGNSSTVQLKTLEFLKAPIFSFGYFYGTNGANVKTLGVSGTNVWGFASNPIVVDPNKTTFSFIGYPVTFSIYAINSANPNIDPTTSGSANLVQTITIDFSKLSNINGGNFATPLAPRWTEKQIMPIQANTLGNIPTTGTTWVTTSGTLCYAAVGGTSTEISKAGYYLYQDQGFDTVMYKDFITNGTNVTVSNCNANISTNWNYRMAIASNRGFPSPLPPNYLPNYFPTTSSEFLIINPYDTVVSMALDPNGPSKGDGRVLAGLSTVTLDYFAPAWTGTSISINGMDNNTIFGSVGGTTKYPRTTMGWQMHTLGRYGTDSGPQDGISSHLRTGAPYDTANKITLFNSTMATCGAYSGSTGNLGKPVNPGVGTEVGVVAFGLTGTMNAGILGDWTNARGSWPDGCMIWVPDQFYDSLSSNLGNKVTDPAMVPYFDGYGQTRNTSLEATYFSPNRQVPSGITLFGTLPSPALNSTTGAPQPWQNLLFCPNPAIGSGHPGFGTIGGNPADHLLLDLFWMPVVEPYAISDPLSTAGKINLNYAIVPFTNIKRQTGLYATMKSEKITAIPNTDPSDSGTLNVMNDYKSAYQMRLKHPAVQTRLNIDTADTLKAFDAKFAAGDIFRSASQLCEMFLYPADALTGANLVSYDSAASNIRNWWSTKQLTGINSREAPYAHIYPRVTTKSNTFQVHYRVQLLKKRTNDPNQAQWVEGQDQVVSEYRGSSILERYIDPNDSRLNNIDFATLSLSNTNAVIDNYYRFRVVGTKTFTP